VKGDLDHQIFHEVIRSLQLSLPFEVTCRVMGRLPGAVSLGQKGVLQEQGEAHQHFAPAHGPDHGFDLIHHLG